MTDVFMPKIMRKVELSNWTSCRVVLYLQLHCQLIKNKIRFLEEVFH